MLPENLRKDLENLKKSPTPQSPDEPRALVDAGNVFDFNFSLRSMGKRGEGKRTRMWENWWE